MDEVTPSEPSLAGRQPLFLFVGDHPAMDLLNTVYKTADGALVDSLKNDDDVLHWLAQAGWAVKGERSTDKIGELLQAALLLRTAIRAVVEARRSGQPVLVETVAPLNRFLAQARSHLELIPATDGSLHLHRNWARKSAEEILAPIAESAAQLFASPDFALVKHCEDAQCVLWFVDRTKSHHRRWCSMAVCGNRNKVAAYRERKSRQA